LDNTIVSKDNSALGQRRPIPAWLAVIVAAAVLLGVGFRFYHLDGKVFWEDEIIGTVHMLGYQEAEVVEASPHLASAGDLQRYLKLPDGSDRRGLGATITALETEDPQHPPLYYLAARLWAGVFGTSAAALRSLAAVFGVVVLLCVYWLCLELFASRQVALIAVALLAVSPFYVLYSQEAREYSLWTVAIMLAGILLLRGRRSAGFGVWVAYAVVVALSLYIYPLTGLVAIGFAVYMLINEGWRFTRPVVACFVASLCALAAFSPWLITMVSSRGLGQGMAGIMRAKLTPSAFAFVLARDLRAPYFDFGAFRIGPVGSTTLNGLLTLFAVALSVYALVAMVRRRPFAVWGFIVVGLCLPLTVLLLQDLLFRGHFVYQARYFIPALLGIQLAVADLFGATLMGRAPSAYRPAWVTLFGLILAGETLSCILASRADTWWNKAYERSRSVAAIVNASSKPIVTGDYYSPSILALGFYLDPGVALAVTARCTQCDVQPPSVPAPDLGPYGSVFVLRQDDPHTVGRRRWINPQTFPTRPDPLNLFTSI
jgi:uncharacterized membrane protein